MNFLMKRMGLMGVAVMLWMAVGAGQASANPGGRPVGTWFGRHADGSGSLTFVLQADGTCLYGPSGVNPVVGRGYWKQMSPTGGIITIRYSNAGYQNNLYYSITWIDADTIVLSDPFFRVTLIRQ